MELSFIVRSNTVHDDTFTHSDIANKCDGQTNGWMDRMAV